MRLFSLILVTALGVAGCSTISENGDPPPAIQNKSTFDSTKQQPPINEDKVEDILNKAAPNAFIDRGQPQYLPVVESDLRHFLSRTRTDRGAWAFAQPQKDSQGKNCSSYSLMLFALMEQERLKCGCEYPLAFGRVKLFDHAVDGFINEHGEFKIVEPQNDRIYSLNDWVNHAGENSIQIITFE